MTLRVLTWNLMHGRAVPSAGHDLLGEFATALAGWTWDVALLQEVPPWWPAALAARLGPDAQARHVLTSRNALLPLRRAIAVRWPDLIKSNGGGANAILVRGRAITWHRSVRLCRWPERRQLHAVELAGRLWVGNLHATVHDDAAARRDAERARIQMLAWARGAPAILGGDFNVRELSLAEFAYLGGHDVDLVFGAGVEPEEARCEVLDRGRLSDHAPVAIGISAPR